MYEDLSNEALAGELSKALGISTDEARKSLESKLLGRDWAIRILNSESEYKSLQDSVTSKRAALRRAAGI
jgi:hypothetical protein